MTGSRRVWLRWLVAVGAALLLLATAAWRLLAGQDEGRAMVSQPAVRTGISSEELTRVAHTRMFFGHQSVGMNVLAAVPGVFASHGVAAPPIEQRRAGPVAGGGFIAHAQIGMNTQPLAKLQDFDAVIRGGMGGQVDVALMKFCYIDVTAGTDVDALFTRYRDTMAALQRDYPKVTFVAVTVPLTTRPGTLARLKQRVSGASGATIADDVARQRLNALLRKEYGDHHLFDLAAVESTAPDRSAVSGQYQGSDYFALYDGYASDNGHLNAEGARRAAIALLAAVAQASGK